ncbi:hypothetical protein V8E51_001314 [Hyaloscypha variabilis]
MGKKNNTRRGRYPPSGVLDDSDAGSIIEVESLSSSRACREKRPATNAKNPNTSVPKRKKASDTRDSLPSFPNLFRNDSKEIRQFGLAQTRPVDAESNFLPQKSVKAGLAAAPRSPSPALAEKHPTEDQASSVTVCVDYAPTAALHLTRSMTAIGDTTEPLIVQYPEIQVQPLPELFRAEIRERIAKKVAEIDGLILNSEALKQCEFPFPVNTSEPIIALQPP